MTSREGQERRRWGHGHPGKRARSFMGPTLAPFGSSSPASAQLPGEAWAAQRGVAGGDALATAAALAPWPQEE